MNAFSSESESISFALRREATTFEVPTSIPIGLAPAFIRSSMRSSASWATFQRWSLRSSMTLSSSAGRSLRPDNRRSIDVLAALPVGLHLLGGPAVVGPLALPAHVLEALPFAPGVVREPLLGRANAVPGHGQHLQEVLIIAESEASHARGLAGVLVGQAESRPREPPGPVHVVPDPVQPGVHAGQAVGDAHLRRDLEALAQVVRQVAPGDQLRLGDRQRLAAAPAALEGDPEERVVEVQVDGPAVLPDGIPRMVRLRPLLHDTEHPPEAIDQVVVGPVALKVPEQPLARVPELLVVARLQRPDIALGRVEQQSDRALDRLTDESALRVEHVVAAGVAPHGPGGLDAQAVRELLEAVAALDLPDRRR